MQTTVDSGLLSSPNSESCMTISGDKPNLPCVFPFSAEGGLVTFHACFWKDDLEDFVCSTKTDSAGNHITGNTGICGESCPKQCNKYLSWPCNGKCIPLGTPCGNDCPSAEHTGLSSYYLHCDGTCGWSKDDGLGFHFEADGRIVDTEYRRLCDGVCQDANIPCNGKCLEVERFSYLDCAGVCSNPAKPSVHTCNGECIPTSQSCHGTCNPLNNWRCPREQECVEYTRVCVGTGWVCSANQGNSRSVCEDPAWRGARCGARKIRCWGARPGQCIDEEHVCDGVYDCIDRSDESYCSTDRHGGQEYKEEIVENLQECRAEDEYNHTYTGLQCDYGKNSIMDLKKDFQNRIREKANKTFDFDPNKISNCVNYLDFCKNENENMVLDLLLATCHQLLHKSGEYSVCSNKTFWDSKPCPSELTSDGERKYTRCRGNNPGQCFQEKCSCSICYAGLGCEDNSEHVCPADDSFCENQFMWRCSDNKTCVHDSLRCDGYVHCQDGSDEKEEFCSICPRSFGYPEKQRDRATYMCKHRYTGRPICSVPCDSEDDMCENMEDENCDEKYYIATGASIVGIAIISVGATLLIQQWRKQKPKEAYLPLTGTKVEKLTEEVCLLIFHYIFQDSRKPKKQKRRNFHKILKVYKDLHSSIDLSSSMKSILLLLETLDETEQREACILFDKMERTVHRGNKLASLTCLKENVGTNTVTMKYFENLEPLGLMNRVKQKVLPARFNKGKTSKTSIIVKIIARGFFLIMGYYSDFVKDIVFLIILSYFVPWNSTPVSSFAFQINLALLISLILPQLLNILVIMENEDLNLSPTFKILLCCFSPVAPAVAVVKMLQEEKKVALTRLKYLDYFLSGKSEEVTFQQHAADLLQAQHSAERWKSLNVLFQRNGINSGNLIHVLVLILLVALRFTKTATVGGLQDLFSSGSDSTVMIVLSAIWSCKSLVTGQLAYWVSDKNEFILVKGKIILAAYFILGVISRMVAFLVYFAPSLGLFDLLAHWKMGSIPFYGKNRFNTDFIYDVKSNGTNANNVWVRSVWVPLTDPTDLTQSSLQTFYLCLVVFFILHWLLLILLSRFMNNRGVTGIINSLVFPPITYEWDTQQNEEVSFKDRWQKTKTGIFIFHFLYFLENVFLCVPIFILSCNINTRNIFHAQLFPILEEERYSTQMAALLGLAPVVFAVSSALQVSLLFLYHRVGHPWQAIWRLKQQEK